MNGEMELRNIRNFPSALAQSVSLVYREMHTRHSIIVATTKVNRSNSRNGIRGERTKYETKKKNCVISSRECE